MSENPRVNRDLKDEAMNRIDHALGRPVDPLGETYRDYFATDGQLADEMAASAYWKERGRRGDMRFFGVTEAGRKALAAHLKEIGGPYRAFAVSFDGHESVVAAPTASGAKYKVWLDASDCRPDLRFRDFVRAARVRRAS